MIGRKHILILILILLGFNSYAQTYTVKATTDSLEYLIGDFIHYKISVEVPDSTEAFVPTVKDSLKDLVLLKQNQSEIKLNNGNKKIIFDYTLAGYDSLDVTIPEVPVIIREKSKRKIDTLFTNKVKLFVSKVKTDPKKDIKDVKDILTIPYDWLQLLLIILGILILLALAYFVYKKFFKNKNEESQLEKIKVILPPHKIAYKKLMELENERLWQQGKIKEYHSKLTEIIREYFENRFGFNSLEMTSAETLDELRKYSVTDEAWEITRKFLEDADMVKFAKFQPMPKVNAEMMKYAYKIIDLTKQAEENSEKANDVQ